MNENTTPEQDDVEAHSATANRGATAGRAYRPGRGFSSGTTTLPEDAEGDVEGHLVSSKRFRPDEDQMFGDDALGKTRD